MKLKSYLKKNKTTQTKFAEISGVKRCLLSTYITGCRYPSYRTALKIEKATNGEVTVLDMISRDYESERVKAKCTCAIAK